MRPLVPLTASAAVIAGILAVGCSDDGPTPGTSPIGTGGPDTAYGSSLPAPSSPDMTPAPNPAAGGGGGGAGGGAPTPSGASAPPSGP